VKRIILAVAMAISVVALTGSVVVAASPAPSPNHGAAVSAVASVWDHVSGKAHGEAVSASASAHGKLISAAAKAKHGAPASPGASNRDAIGDAASEPGQLKAAAGQAHQP